MASTDAAFDVVCLTETWLCGKISDAELFGPEFQVFRRDRHSTLEAPVGGGVLCAVRRDVPCLLVDALDSGDLEFLCVALRFQHRSVYVAVVYVPPGSSPGVYERLTSVVDDLMDALGPLDELLLMGDFNLPMVDWTSHLDDGELRPSFAASPALHVSTFLDGLSSLGLSQCSGVVNSSGRSLDLVFCSDSDGTMVKHCLTPLIPETGYHPALHVVFFFHSAVDSSLCFSGNYCYNFRKADFSKLSEWLSSIDWSSVLAERDIDAAVEKFYDIVFLCFANCVPRSKANCSQSRQPWLNDSLKHLKNLKSKAWKRYCSSRSDADYLTFCDLQSRYVMGLEVSYDEYVQRMRHAVRREPKRFWRFVNSKRKCDGYPSTLRLGDCVGTDPLLISNLFGDFFKTAFCDKDCDVSSLDFTYMTGLPPTSLCPKDLIIDEASITAHFSKLDLGFSSGPDGIPSAFVKECGSSFVHVLCYLFNLSIISGVFPSQWKVSLIIPLHKKGNRNDISNYRPVANLSCVAKLFEALLCQVLYFHSKPFLGSFQHGFVKGKSTTTNLLEFSNYCISAFEAGGQVDCIFTDFSKAFDRISHAILIYKLSILGFPEVFINWLSSYLRGRTQRVLFRGALSDELNNSSGVPQGSHLGPLLFIIYINDVSLILSNSRVLCYADDAKIYRVVSNYNDCVSLDSDVNAFYNWCCTNRLPLNVSKCTSMTFSRKRTPLLFDYAMEGCSLSRLDVTKDLGVVLDSRLCFNQHIDAVVSKANSTLGFVKRWSKEFDDPYITKLLYCTFVRPTLEYASSVWSPFYAVHINRIEAVQRRFLRFALRDLPWSNPTILPPYRDRLSLIGLESLESRRNNSRVVFVLNCLQGSINSPEILGMFDLYVPPRPLRSHGFFHISHHRTNYGANEPTASMSRLFNDRCEYLDFHLSKTEIRNQLR